MVYGAPLPNRILFLFQFYSGVNSGPRGADVNLGVEEAVKGRPALAVGAASGQAQESGRKGPSCSISSPCPGAPVRRMLHLAQAAPWNLDSASGWLCFSTVQCRRG